MHGWRPQGCPHKDPLYKCWSLNKLYSSQCEIGRVSLQSVKGCGHPRMQMQSWGMSLRVTSLLFILCLLILGYTYGHGRIISRFLGESTEELADDVSHTLGKIAHRGRAVGELKLSDVIALREKFELVDPHEYFPLMAPEEEQLLGSLLEYAENCEPALTVDSRSPLVNKFFLWIQFQCGHVQSLGKEFFTSEPFLSPLGPSYVLLAMEHSKKDGLQLPDQAWKWTHVLESRSLLKHGVALGETEQLLAQLWPGQILAMEEQSPLIPGPELVGIRDGNGSYLFINGASFLRALQANYLQMISSQKMGCVRAGSYCLLRDLVSLEEDLQRFTRVAWASGAGAGFFFFLWVGVFLLGKRRAERERLLIMHTLTHELRTPTTSINLSLEKLREQFDHLDEESQGELLRMVDEVQRLQKVIYVSKDYLQTNASGPLRINCVPVESIDDLLLDVAEGFSGDVGVQRSGASKPWKVDPYWITICVENLVRNALTHGKPPVQISARVEGERGVIEVQDSGDLPEAALSAIGTPFSKSSESSGMGLGVSIVYRVAQAMGGNLVAKRSPTRFCIYIPGVECVEGGER